MNREFTITDGQIIIVPSRKNAKPITGTKLGGITGDNPYSSPFVVFMDLYRFSIPFTMNLKVFVGMALEDSVIENVNVIEGMNFGAYEKTSSGFMSKFYDWDLENGPGKRFNGLIDGWDKTKKIVAECKISGERNFLGRDNLLPAKYGQRPPEYYFLQMGMYAILADAKEVWLTAYKMPESFYQLFYVDGKEPTEFNAGLTKKIIEAFKFDESRYESWKYEVKDIEGEVKSKLRVCTNWQNEFVFNRKAPKATPFKKCDVELIKSLVDAKTITIKEANSLLNINSPIIKDVFANAANDPKWIPYNIKKYNEANIGMSKDNSSLFKALCKLHWL